MVYKKIILETKPKYSAELCIFAGDIVYIILHNIDLAVFNAGLI